MLANLNVLNKSKCSFDVYIELVKSKERGLLLTFSMEPRYGQHSPWNLQKSLSQLEPIKIQKTLVTLNGLLLRSQKLINLL